MTLSDIEQRMPARGKIECHTGDTSVPRRPFRKVVAFQADARILGRSHSFIEGG
jgi:hypothetical protein